jgi:peptidoglycan/xylan/chitin deacetylase (PgdA/CDA1 family)
MAHLRIIVLIAFTAMLWLSISIVTTAQPLQTKPREIPALCYHQIRNYKASDGASARSYTVTPAHFASHMKMLHDSGFQTVLPDQLYAWYTQGLPLPNRPVMISFDDNTASQYTNALPVLDRYQFKAVFFVMTVSIDKPAYMSTNQMQQLIHQGHVLGVHTWNHENVKSYAATDWKTQLDKPLVTLQKLTRKPVYYFAYPYGAWTPQAAQTLKERGIKMAFILHTPQDNSLPLYTVRRLMVLGPWSDKTLAKKMTETFNKSAVKGQ